MKRKHKKYVRPRKLYDSSRIGKENQLLEKYGLKNKKEIWKTESKIKYYKNRAKSLLTSDNESQQRFFDKLNLMGLNVNSIADVLALDKEDLLKRRLSSVIVSKGLANTSRQARQMIVHKRIAIGNSVVNIPSYIVGVAEEKTIKVKEKNKKEKIVEESEENTQEAVE